MPFPAGIPAAGHDCAGTQRNDRGLVSLYWSTILAPTEGLRNAPSLSFEFPDARVGGRERSDREGRIRHGNSNASHLLDPGPTTILRGNPLRGVPRADRRCTVYCRDSRTEKWMIDPSFPQLVITIIYNSSTGTFGIRQAPNDLFSLKLKLLTLYNRRPVHLLHSVQYSMQLDNLISSTESHLSSAKG